MVLEHKFTKNTITYLIYCLNFLDDDIFKKLIKRIYLCLDFKIAPFKTYKEFFLYLLLVDKTAVNYKTEITYEDLATSKEEIVMLQDNDELESEERMCEDNIYNELKCEVEGVSNLQNTYINGDDIEDLLNYYNSKYIETKNANQIILCYLNHIIDSIVSFLPKNFAIDDEKKFKKFFNFAINKIIDDGYCYKVWQEEYLNGINNNYLLDKITLMPLYDHNKANINAELYNIEISEKGFSIFDNKHTANVSFKQFFNLYNSRSLKNYEKFNKAIDEKLIALNKKIKNQYCHICNPYDNPDKGVSKHKCQNCQDIYNLIMSLQLDKKLTTNTIGGRIKGKYEDDNKLGYHEKKRRHYDNLIRFIEDLKNQVEEEYKRKIEEISNKKNREELLQNVNLIKEKNTETINGLPRLIKETFGYTNI